MKLENKNAYEYWIYTPLLDEFVTNDFDAAERAWKYFVEFAKKQPVESNSTFVKQTRYGRTQKMYDHELMRELTEAEIEAYIVKSDDARYKMNKCFMAMRLSLSSMSDESKDKLMKEIFAS